MTARLALDRLEKAYAAPVLKGVTLALAPGEVHALCGENGAGKSTLARIVCGLAPADAGEMRLDGAPWAPPTKRAASDAGVRIVLQELGTLGTLTVAENIFLADLPRRFGLIDKARLRRDARAAMEAVGLTGVDPDQPVAGLGIGQQQLVEIAAALTRPCKLLILDEPTAALTRTETELLFTQVRRLRAAGTTVVYISHRLEEIAEIADRVSVLRDGVLVTTDDARRLRPDEIVRHMAGRAVDEARPSRPDITRAEVVLKVTGLRAPPPVRDVGFELRRGEILGFAGLMGAGRTEAMRALFGADRRDAGEVVLRGQPVDIRSPGDATRLGLAFVTEDRKGEGLLLPLPLRANVTLGNLAAFAGRGGLVRAGDEVRAATDAIARLRIRCAGPEQPASELSGGNQQKVVIARWLLRDADVLIFDEPTRGIDVAARWEIYRLLWALADAGKSILVVSSDNKELTLLCDRIAVLSLGVVAATFERSRFDEEAILAAAFSQHRTSAASRAEAVA